MVQFVTDWIDLLRHSETIHLFNDPRSLPFATA